MLGAAIAGLAVIGTVVFTVIRRDSFLFVLIAIFILTAEMGEGFTSFQGSVFFNQDFLDLAKLKLVEVILYAYTAVLVMSDIYNHRTLPTSSLRRLYWFWLAWAAVLLFVQFDTRGSIELVTFRNVLFGWAVLYVFSSVIDSRPVMQRVMLFTLILLTVKAIWLMVMFAIGRGDHSPRGSTPIFWDDKLLEAFTWGLLVLLVSLLQPRSKRGYWPTSRVAGAMALIAVLIALSLRRNYLGQVVAGTVFVLFNRYRQVHMERFLSLALIVAVLLGVVFTAGQVVGNRLPLVQQLTEYVQLLNFASATSFTGVADNQVHLFNVQTYTLLLSRYGGIRLFGVSAAPTDNFRDFNREYLSSLGLAHNGPLRAIFEFGIGGLLVWSAFFFIAFRAVRRCRFERLEPWEQAVALGTGATVFSHFVITLTFVPPFFTTLKILFFFLVFVYVLEFYSRESNLPEAQAARPIVAADRYSLPPSADRNPYRRDFLCPPSS